MYNTMSIYKNIKRLLQSMKFDSNKWSRYNATESEVIVKVERDEHPHCKDHHPDLHIKELSKLDSKINAKNNPDTNIIKVEREPQLNKLNENKQDFNVKR